MADYEMLGKRLKEYRVNYKKEKISAEQMAKKIGISRATLCRYENGISEKIPYDIFQKYCSVLEIDPSTFYSEVGIPYSQGKLYNDPIKGFAHLLQSGLADAMGLGLTDEQLADDKLMTEKAREIIALISNMKQL